MKKLLTKFTVMALSFVMCFAAFGCKTDMANREADQKLEVFIADRGYGTLGIEAALVEFAKQDWVKEKYPNLEIPKPYTSRTPNLGLTRLSSPSNNNFDLIFIIENFRPYMKRDANGKALICDITESVYNSTVPGENILFKDKILPEFEDYCTIYEKELDRNSNFDVPWVTGYHGFIYNPEILARYDLSDEMPNGNLAPNTTDEFLAVCEAIKNEPTKSGNDMGFAVGACGTNGYDNTALTGWWAQYDGVKAYEDFFAGYYTTPGTEGTEFEERYLSHKVFELEGRRKALEVMGHYLTPYKGYYDARYIGMEFMQLQTLLLQGMYAFSYCADWFDSEMALVVEDMEAKGEHVSPILLLQTPVISAIVEKLEYRENNNAYMTDDKLSFVIKCIDDKKAYDVTRDEFAAKFAGAPELPELSENDYNKLKETRAQYTQAAINHTGAIPEVSNSKDVAIDFLRFLATDVCQLAYMKATNGQNLPFNFNIKDNPAYDAIKGGFSDMQENRLDFFYNEFNPSIILRGGGRKPLGLSGLLTGQLGSYWRSAQIGGTTTIESLSLELWQQAKDAHNEDRFNFMCFEAGLIDSY